MPHENRATLPTEFGALWSDFDREWLLGLPLGYSQLQVITSLDALKRLWPAYLSNLIQSPNRGVLALVGAVELGSLLADCEDMTNFSKVVSDLKRTPPYHRGTYSELVMASTLTRFGYRPSLQPLLQSGNVLDIQCDVAGVPIYFEVVTPEPSHDRRANEGLVQRLRMGLLQQVSKCRLEVALL